MISEETSLTVKAEGRMDRRPFSMHLQRIIGDAQISISNILIIIYIYLVSVEINISTNKRGIAKEKRIYLYL